MRKLKVALIVLFAMVMSLGLVACRDKNKDEKVISRISSVSGIPTLTDSDTLESWNEKAAKIKVKVRYEELSNGEQPEDETLEGQDVKTEIVGIKWSDPQIGDYTLIITPAVHNANNKTEERTISLEHDFGTPDANDVETCRKCGARRTSRDENVQLKYQDFHSGYSASGAVFNNKLEGETYSYDANANSAFKKFGNVTVWNGDEEYSAEVPTVTVGRLEKGSTISVTGTAVEELDGSAEQYWFFPIIGIADRNANGTNPAYPESAYKGGTSVIMRNDGHILYNGIGQGTYSASSGPFSGAKLAALAGGDSEDGFPNYGSGTLANSSSEVSWPDDWPAGYGELGVLPDVASWPNWYVYSTNDGSIRSPGPYAVETDVVLTWTYRNDGVIEMTISASDGEYVFKGYVKVPDSPSGYYETILHGERTRYTFSKSSIIETRTVKGVQIDSNEKINYYQNEMIDASKVKIRYQYDSGWESAAVTADMLEAKVGENWVKLDTTPLAATMTEFRVHVVKGSFEGTVDFTDAMKPQVIENAIGTVNGNNYKNDDKLLNNDKVGAFALSVETGTQNYIVLTPVLAADTYNWAQKITDTTGWTNGTPADANRYIVLRFDAGEYGTFTKESVTVKSGDSDVLYKLHVEEDNKVAYLALALTKDLAKTPIIVTGLNATPVKIDLTGLRGFDATSSIDGSVALVGETPVTAYYTVEKGTTEDKLTISVNGSDVALSSITSDETATMPSGFYFKVKKDITQLASDGIFTVTVTFSAPGNLKEVGALQTNTIGLKLDGDLVALDTVGYDFNAGGEYGGYVVQYGFTDIYFIKGVAISDMQATEMHGSITVNINAGGDSYENVRPLELSYGYSMRSGIHFTNVVDSALATISIKMIGTVNDASDVDSGYVVIIKINVSELGVRTTDPSEDYYFEIVGEVKAPQLKYYKVSGFGDATTTQVIDDKTVSDDDKVLLKEGDCLTESGLVAYVIKGTGKESDKVIFYAGATVIGGGHTWDDAGTTCERCGATKDTAVTLTHDEADWNKDTGNTTRGNLYDGDFVEISGKYNGNHAKDYTGIETNVRQGAGSAFYVRVRNDGVCNREDGGDNQVKLLYNSTPANTVNGVPNGIDGEPISTDSGDYIRAKQNGYFKVTAYYTGRILTITSSLWTKDQDMNAETPYFSFTVQMQVGGMADYVLVRFRIDTYENNPTVELDGNATFVRGKIAQSTITTITTNEDVTAGVGENTTATFKSDEVSLDKTSAYTSEYAEGVIPTFAPSLVLKGIAAELSAGQKTALGITDEYKHYVSFKTTIGSISGKTTVRLIDLSTGKEYANGYVKLDGTSLEVVIPFEANTLYKLDFANDIADMHQGDVVIDLRQVSLANVRMTVSSTADILGGEATVNVTGEAPAGTKLELGEASLVWSEIKQGDTLGDLTVKSVEGDTVTFTVPAADLTKPVTAYELHLRTAEEGFLADGAFDTLQIPASADSVTVIDNDVYVKAEGNTLTLVTASGVGKDATKSLYLNVNGGTATVGTSYELVSNYNISVKIDSNGAPAFVNAANNVTENGTLVWSNVGEKYLLVLTLDLSDLNIETNTAYGFQLATGVAEMGNTLYVVKADRSIGTATLSGSEQLNTLKTSNCNTTGLAAKLYSGEGISFYYDVQVTRAHTFEADDKTGLLVCSVCGTIAVDGDAYGKLVPALAGISESGMSFSYQIVSWGDEDWANTAIETTLGNVQIQAGNLKGNVQVPNSIPHDLKGSPVNENLWPKLGSKETGIEWNYYQTAGTYITVTIDATTGDVKFYKNGALAITYVGTLNGSGGAFTVKQFTELFLKLGERGGFRLFGDETLHGRNVSIVKKVLTAEEVGARYSLYLSEADSLPDGAEYTWKGCGSSHTYGEAGQGTDTWCVYCGNLNPNHTHKYEGNNCVYCGEENAGHTHSYAPDTHKCAEDNAVNPADSAHESSYVDGVCSVCGHVCTHEGADISSGSGTCTHCNATYGDQSSTVAKSDVKYMWDGYNTWQLHNGETLVLTATHTGGNRAWGGVNCFIFDRTSTSQPNKDWLYIMRAAGDVAATGWSWGPAGVTLNPGFTNADAFVTAKETGNIQITVTMLNGKITIEYKIWAAGKDTASAAADYTLTAEFSNMTLDVYDFGVAIDRCTATEDDATADGKGDVSEAGYSVKISGWTWAD